MEEKAMTAAEVKRKLDKTIKDMKKERMRRRKSFEALSTGQQRAIVQMIRTSEEILDCARSLMSFSYSDLMELEAYSHQLTHYFSIEIDDLMKEE